MRRTKFEIDWYHNPLMGWVLNIATRLVYWKAIRKPLVNIADHWLARKLTSSEPLSGFAKIEAQRNLIYRAVLRTVDRALSNRTLNLQVAQKIFRLWGGVRFQPQSRRRIVKQFEKDYETKPPWFLVISPTHACNLNCAGCYANSGNGNTSAATLPWDLLDRIMGEARDLWGVPLFVFSGGEPLTYRSQGKDLLDIVEKYPDCLFLMFTNGTLVTQETARRLAKLGNLTPAISVEGLQHSTDQRRGTGIFGGVLRAMSYLRQEGVPFGVSITATRQNCDRILSDDLLDFYFGEQGAFYGFIFQYMPIGRNPNPDWLPTVDQRLAFYRRSWQVVKERGIFLLDFWNHGPLVEGCIAAGRERGYFHIDWNGKVMPCVFLPYAGADMGEIYAGGGNLIDAWKSPFFQMVRQWQREYGYGCQEVSARGNWMLPCPFRDHFSLLRSWVETCHPQPEEGIAGPWMLEETFWQGMSACEQEQFRAMQLLWEKEFVGGMDQG
mgnify:CR=1 FL=1